MVNKIIWIDVGTHFAQEYKSIFDSNLSFYFNILVRLLSGNILGRGQKIDLGNLKKIILSRSHIKKKSKDFFTIFIEANPKVVFKKVYKKANIVLNLALTDSDYPSLSIKKLYLGTGGNLSQSGTLFVQKHLGYEDKYVQTIAVPAVIFFEILEKYLSKEFSDYAVILRLNCEGVEDSVIYSAYKSFGEKLRLICGVLKDVKELKGPEAFLKLEQFIEDKQINYAKFASPISTWHEGQTAIQKLLDQLDTP